MTHRHGSPQSLLEGLLLVPLVAAMFVVGLAGAAVLTVLDRLGLWRWRGDARP